VLTENLWRPVLLTFGRQGAASVGLLQVNDISVTVALNLKKAPAKMLGEPREVPVALDKLSVWRIAPTVNDVRASGSSFKSWHGSFP
jgi:hypothetical protein